MSLNTPQNMLVAATTDWLVRHWVKDRHHVAAGVLTSRGTHFGLHLDTSGCDFCAEPVAIANALQSDDLTLRDIVAVFWDGDPSNPPCVIPPCGDCRQLLVEYAPDIHVIIPEGDDLAAVSASDLLPYPYAQTPRKVSVHDIKVRDDIAGEMYRLRNSDPH